MTASSVNLGGNPVKFSGAYIRSITANHGWNTNSSTISLTLIEDTDFGVTFVEPAVGTYIEVDLNGNWSSGGIIQRYERAVRDISGRGITVQLVDARQMMGATTVIIAPGYAAVGIRMRDTGCSILDVFGAYGATINISGWNQSGMPYSSFALALNGGGIASGQTDITIEQQVIKYFGDSYRINISEISNYVSPSYRINTNLVSLANIIEDLAKKHSFDWYVESAIADDGIIDVTLKTIDRSTDNIDVSLSQFLASNTNKVKSATSGIELRSEVSCAALLGAPYEQIQKIDIFGMANEPLDLSIESGSAEYLMTENEIRAVLNGKQSWEMWVDVPSELGGGGGFSRYGGYCNSGGR